MDLSSEIPGAAEILSHFEKVKKNGRGWTALCPAHEDQSPSLSITETDSKWLLHCHAGCAYEAVVDAAGLREAFTVKDPTGPQIVAEYDYVDEDGKPLYQVVRYAPKDFRQRRRVNGEWVWSLGDTRRVPYRLPEVLAAVAAGSTVYVVEGEKDAEALRAAGAAATTNAGGAGKWKPEYGEFLTGAHVVIVADKDEPGRTHAASVAASVKPHAASVRVVEAAEGKDAADHLRAGKTLAEFLPVTDGGEKRPMRFYTVPELADLPDARVDWILKGYCARGMLTQLTGGPKLGKTTFLGAGAAAVSEGRPFIGMATTQTPVLYYTEEGRQTFMGMMRRVCATDAAKIHVLLRSQTFGRSWPDVCEAMRDYRNEHDIGLVIVDTFTDLAGLAGEDENISGPVLKAIGYLRPIADDGAAVVIVRHDRKEGGSLVDSGRGSGAFAGAVDILMALRKKGETQREILGIGRPEGVPDSVFITFDGIEYSAADDPRRARDLDLERTLLAVLPHEEGQAIGIEEVVALIHRSLTTTTKQLKRLRDEGAVKSGRGKGRVTAPQAIGWWAP